MADAAPAATGDAPAGGEQQQEAGQPDLGQTLQEQLAPMQQQFEQIRQFMENTTQQAETPAEAATEQQPVDFSYLNPDAPEYDPQAAAQQLLGVIAQQQQAGLQPLTEQLQQVSTGLQDMRTEQEARALADEFPDLQDQEVSDKVFTAAEQWVQAAGLPPEAASNMQVVRAVYMMGRAAELANEEGQQPGPGAATLEGGGGAAPAAPAGGLTAESIIGGRTGSVLPFG